ncbi:MAG: TrkH family potassium uptake protein [Eubacterium sp.]|nr:TrkH family potassium uptake protein [Eubacterium sp.]
MNLSIIRRILGYVLILEAALLLLPTLVGFIYGEKEFRAYLIVSAICVVCGGALGIKKPKNTVYYLKEGCVATALSWIVLSVFGCIPFMITREIPNFIDALFETVSGFTTTGASVVSNVEGLATCTLFWRSFTHWIGGMGILVFIMAVVPLSGGGSNINLLRAESPGPSVSKLVPKMRETARYLYVIYIVFTLLEALLLKLGGMRVVDALMTSFSTAGTGGFGIKNDSIAGYSYYIKWVVTVFMVMFGVNFNAYFLIIRRQFKKAFTMEEVRWYFGIILIAIGAVFYDLKFMSHGSTANSLTDSAFQVASIITTTGFSTADFDTWHQLSKGLLLWLMFIGACAGSTGGGVKVQRIVIVIKNAFRELHYYIHPKSVKKVKMDGKPVDESIVKTINTYTLTAVGIIVVSFFILSAQGNNTETNFSAVMANINNIGPGFDKCGAVQNYAFFHPLSKLVLIFDMLIGRLELYPMLILFNPKLWQETLTQSNHRLKKRLQK